RWRTLRRKLRDRAGGSGARPGDPARVRGRRAWPWPSIAESADEAGRLPATVGRARDAGRLRAAGAECRGSGLRLALDGRPRGLPQGCGLALPLQRKGAFPFDRDQPVFEPVTLLAYLAGRTTRVRLGISVLVLPMRNPVITAKMLADIDNLTRGRLELGVGVG